MLSHFFHNWERRLVAVTKDRVVRPFDWGVDWIPINGQRAQAPLDAAPAAQVRGWIDGVMRDTDAFFDVPPTRAYEFTPAESAISSAGEGGLVRGGARRQGGHAAREGGTLRFPSAMTTPHPENNTVVARWFPAAGEPRVGAPGRRGRAVVVLPQWNADSEGHVGLSRLLARFGVSALRLSLPYHDARMPPELSRADYIVSANVVRTVQVCRQAVLDARRAIGWLADQGYERIGILGTSLGSCLALLTSAHEPRIRVQALNHVSPWFADVVWRGLSTRHVREGLEGNIDLDALRDLWRPINPWSYLERIRNTQSLLVYARYDLTFPVDLSRVLISEFDRLDLPHEVAALPCGHYSTGVAPFSYLDAFVLTRFLVNNL